MQSPWRSLERGLLFPTSLYRKCHALRLGGESGERVARLATRVNRPVLPMLVPVRSATRTSRPHGLNPNHYARKSRLSITQINTASGVSARSIRCCESRDPSSPLCAAAAFMSWTTTTAMLWARRGESFGILIRRIRATCRRSESLSSAARVDASWRDSISVAAAARSGWNRSIRPSNASTNSGRVQVDARSSISLKASSTRRLKRSKNASASDSLLGKNWYSDPIGAPAPRPLRSS